MNTVMFHVCRLEYLNAFNQNSSNLVIVRLCKRKSAAYYIVSSVDIPATSHFTTGNIWFIWNIYAWKHSKRCRRTDNIYYTTKTALWRRHVAMEMFVMRCWLVCDPRQVLTNNRCLFSCDESGRNITPKCDRCNTGPSSSSSSILATADKWQL